MAVVRKIGQLSTRLLVPNRPIICLSRSVTEGGREKPWYENWEPGPYPRTEEERRAAAEKYNLHPDEYEPYPEEKCYGDYPKLPKIGQDARDPYYPWDMPLYRKNYHEPLHEDYDLMGQDRYPYGVRQRLSRKVIFSTFLGVVSSVAFICWIVGDTNPPVLERQYPKDGPHYTFEAAN